MCKRSIRRLTGAVVAGAAALFVTNRCAVAASRPNVILILADDMGFSDPGCYGSEIHTPNLDAMARQGVRFAQFYNMARCCPTRASLLTGLYPHQAGISTPFIVRWPGTVNQTGQIQHDQVGDVIDVMPTVLDVAGANYPATFNDHAIVPEEGIDLLSVIKGGNAIARGPLCWEHEGNRAVRMGNWKLVAPHGEGWKLFDMIHDRTELKDVSSDHPDEVAKLHSAYDAWVKRCGVEEWPIPD